MVSLVKTIHGVVVLDTVTMMKVENGEEFYGSKDLVVEDGDYTHNWIDRNYVVTGVSEGNVHSNFLVVIESEKSV